MRIVVTGPPGSGKTTLLEMGKTAIDKTKHLVLPDYARFLIEQKGYIPTQDHLRFQYEWVDLQITAFLEYSNCIFTYGLPDVIVYFIWRDGVSFTIPDFFYKIIESYKYDAVFLIETLPEKYYTKDIAKTMPYDETINIMKIIEDIYPRYGYEMIHIPYLPFKERTSFFLDRLNKLLS